MAKDIMITEGMEGQSITFNINDEDGDPDDLSTYTTVRMVWSPADFSASTLNLTQAAAEIDIATLGKLKFTPSAANPIPVFGDYIVQIFRESSGVNKPTIRFSVRASQEAQKT